MITFTDSKFCKNKMPINLPHDGFTLLDACENLILCPFKIFSTEKVATFLDLLDDGEPQITFCVKVSDYRESSSKMHNPFELNNGFSFRAYKEFLEVLRQLSEVQLDDAHLLADGLNFSLRLFFGDIVIKAGFSDVVFESGKLISLGAEAHPFSVFKSNIVLGNDTPVSALVLSGIMQARNLKRRNLIRLLYKFDMIEAIQAQLAFYHLSQES